MATLWHMVISFITCKPYAQLTVCDYVTPTKYPIGKCPKFSCLACLRLKITQTMKSDTAFSCNWTHCMQSTGLAVVQDPTLACLDKSMLYLVQTYPKQPVTYIHDSNTYMGFRSPNPSPEWVSHLPAKSCKRSRPACDLICEAQLVSSGNISVLWRPVVCKKTAGNHTNQEGLEWGISSCLA
jgi:hypothetical protein